jgi:hypothetical protein
MKQRIKGSTSANETLGVALRKPSEKLSRLPKSIELHHRL